MPREALPEPVFRMDPSDMQQLRRQMQTLPDAHRLSPITIEACLVGADVLLQLPEVAARYNPSRILLVIDDVVMWRGTQSLKPLVLDLLSGLKIPIDVLTIPPGHDGMVHASVENAELVRGRITPGTLVVSVGSGSITDTTKHGCFLHDQEANTHTPWIAIQTANTVTAFTSNNAVLLKDGVKRTFHSRFPDVLVSDLRVLACAPIELTRAGIGDMTAKWVCYGDWYLANRAGVAPTFSEAPLVLMEDLDRLVLPYAGPAAEGDLTGVEVLTKALLLSGMAMAIVDETTPLSGYEHVQSHVLDMTAEHYGRPMALHGLQVGVTALMSAAAWDLFLNEFDPDQLPDATIPSDDEAKQRIEAVFGKVDPSGLMAQECWNDCRQKLHNWRAADEGRAQLRAAWDSEVRPRLREMVYTPEQIAEALAASGCALTGDELSPAIPEEQIRFAFEHAHLIRKRFTLADLLAFMGWTGPAFTDRVLARVARAISHARQHP